MDCIFCKIIDGSIPAEKVYENDQLIVFKDINPVAPIHVLLVPKEHYQDLLELAATQQSATVLKAVADTIKVLAEQYSIQDKGFRLINNCGKEGGQTVMHLHFHLIAGQELGMKLV